MRDFWVKSVDATHILFIPNANYFLLKEGWLKFDPCLFCHGGFCYYVNEPFKPKALADG